MPCFIDYDTDGPEFSVVTTRTARKPHTCLECGGKIEPGTKYERASGKWEGHMDTIITCGVCAEIRNRLFQNWTYGAMWDDLKNCADDLELGDLDGLSLEAIGKLEYLYNGTSFAE